MVKQSILDSLLIGGVTHIPRGSVFARQLVKVKYMLLFSAVIIHDFFIFFYWSRADLEHCKAVQQLSGVSQK